MDSGRPEEDIELDEQRIIGEIEPALQCLIIICLAMIFLSRTAHLGAGV